MYLKLTLIDVLHMTSQHLVLHTHVMGGYALPHLPRLGLLHHLAPHALHSPMEHCFVQHLLCDTERHTLMIKNIPLAIKYIHPIMSMGLVMCLTPSSIMLDMQLHTSVLH